jgi:hypothetical protein
VIYKVAALFVDPFGPYSCRSDIDAWTIYRDARRYNGPFPVVAHPPCERWGRYWSGGPNPRAQRRDLGDDGGCFESALRSVRLWGGVLEHLEASHAWRFFSIAKPPREGGWVSADSCGGWTTCVEQGHYGHHARKATWLYVFGVPFSDLPDLPRGPADGNFYRLDQGFRSKGHRERAKLEGNTKPHRRTHSSGSRLLTPPLFAEQLIGIARQVNLNSPP